MIGIYKITNKINNKCYIGQSINLEQRIRTHKYAYGNNPLHFSIRKYGVENFIFEILCECSKEDLDRLEKKYIKLYQSNNNKYGYNQTKGGTNIPQRLITLKNQPKEKERQRAAKISKKLKGRKMSDAQKELLSKRLKELYKDPEYLKKISKIKKGKKLTLMTRLKLSMTQQVVMKKYGKKVLQYDLSNNLIATYNNLQEIKKKTKFQLGNISMCCNGKRHTAYGFKWKYDEVFNKNNRQSINRNIKPKEPLKGRPKDIPCRWKKVYQYDDNFNLIRIFNSFKEVETIFKSYKNVSCCCRGLREHAYGYRWSYVPINK